MTSDLRHVVLPASLCEAVEQRFATHFGSLEQFLSFLLDEVLRNDAARMSETEQHIVEERLRELGYM